MFARIIFQNVAQVFDVVGNILSRGVRTHISWSTFIVYRVQRGHIVGNQKNGIVGNILLYRGNERHVVGSNECTHDIFKFDTRYVNL